MGKGHFFFFLKQGDFLGTWLYLQEAVSSLLRGGQNEQVRQVGTWDPGQ